jgi:hypothetical protein
MCSCCDLEPERQIPAFARARELLYDTAFWHESSMATKRRSPQAPSPTHGRSLGLLKLLVVAWTLGFVPLFVAFRSHLEVALPYRSLVGTALFCAPGLVAFWLLGRERHPTLRAWRIFFVHWPVLLTPLLLTLVDGIAEQGWPSGRYNRTTAKVLVLVLTFTVPQLLTGLSALVRTYRLAGVLALVSGLCSLGVGVPLLQATAEVRPWVIRLTSVLNILAFGSKLESYLAIPIGIVFVVGGILTLRAARTRVPAPRAAP